MIRLLGCVLIAGAAAFLGFSAAGRLTRRVRVLEELISGLQLLEQELELSAPELDTLMESLSRRCRGRARELFSTYAVALTRLGEKTAAALWEECVHGVEDLIPEGKVCIASLGEVLGRYDSREQRACAAAVRQRLERICEQAREDCRRRGQACRTVGLTGGAFLIILLL